MFEEFQNKTIFITGAASGMGRATALRFASLGAKVAVVARNVKGGNETVQMIREAGGTAEFVLCDVSKDEEVKNAVAKTVELFGSLDYAFNNAGCGADGVHIPFAPLTEVTEEDWLKVINTNLTGVFHCLKYELQQMNRQHFGAIVNTSSIGGMKMAPGFGAYGPSKAGVIAITQTAAVENAKNGIRVNAICPGPTMGTGLMDASLASGAQDPAFMEANVIPQGKMGTTDEIVDGVVFLCSELSSHITGTALPVCGGMQM
ncbi:MAG: SDR family oxidoreductase [Oscillospiraceae bacterium]|nr:SDR family oxidoreductase [Oscillospiraceae bacterium]